MMAGAAERESKRCRRCGQPLGGTELGGNCPRCLAALLFSPETPVPNESGTEQALPCLGDYQLLEEVARGGMGVVFRALQTSLNREVAVKLLRDAWLATPVQVKRFHAEAANAAKLNHPNIVSVHEVGECNGQHYFAMDLVKGTNLAELTREGPLPPRWAAELIKKISEAVQHAHQHGVLHRDLKPSNVLLDQEGEPHVTDFGLARPMDEDSSLTLTGQVIGTPSYMAPEQARGGGTVGPAADVYGLGAMLFHLLTARAPFVGASAAETLTQVLQQEPLSPRLLNPGVPVDLAAVCLKCLRKAPRERYGSAGELADDLGRFLRDETTKARPERPIERSVRWCRRNPVLAAFLIVVPLSLILGMSTTLWQWRRAKREAHTAEEALWHAQLQEAQAYRLNGGIGQRTKSLETIARAAAYRPSVDLRNEAIAALVLPDLGTNLWWHKEDDPLMPSAFTGDLEFFVRANATGHIAICRSSNQQLVREFSGPTNGTRTALFSPDARFLAVRFFGGQIRVWEWRSGNYVLAAPCWSGDTGDPVFDYTPDSRELWVASADRKVERYALPKGKRLAPALTNVTAMGLRLDPAGRQLLAFAETAVSAWNVTTGERLGAWTLPGAVWRVAWHPHGRNFAIGTYEAGVFAGEIGQTNLDLYETSMVAPTVLSFTPDGSQLLAGGWGNLFAVWDFATRRLALWSRQLWLTQLSDDGHRAAVLSENRGYGVRQFLAPACIRRFRVPGALVGETTVAWHPSGKWLVMGHLGGWSLWDAQRGELLRETRTAVCSSIEFLQDGSGFLTGGVRGPELWPFKVADGNPEVGPPRRLLREDAGTDKRATLSPDGTRFAAIGTNGGFVGSLAMESAPLRIPGSEEHDTIQFSPDGHWLRIGRFREKVIHFHSASDRTLVTNLPTGSPAMVFVPGRNEILASEPSGFSFWQVGTWHKLREMALPDNGACEQFVGFWPDASCGLAQGKDTMLRLWDTESNREIACLRLPEGSAAWDCVFDPSGHFMATTSSHPFLRLWDFPALRRELRALGLDWPDGRPADGFAGTGARQPSL